MSTTDDLREMATIAQATRFLTVPRAYRPTPAPGGGLAFASDMAGLAQTYLLSAPDRFPVRVAPSQDRVLPVAHTPQGLLVRFDEGGNEVWQLGLVGAGGRLRPLTGDAKAIHRGVTVAPDGRSAGLAYNPGGRADWVLAELDLETGAIEHRLDRGGHWTWTAWGPDRLVAVSEDYGSLRNAAHLLAPDGTLSPLLPEARLVADVFWGRDGLFALTNLEREFVGLAEVDSGDPGRIVRWVVLEDRHDVRAAVCDPTGTLALVVVNQGPYDELRVVELASGAARGAGSLPPGMLYSDNSTQPAEQVAWSAAGTSLFVAWESASLPAELYEVPVGKESPAVVWTRAGGARPSGLAEPAEVRIPSFDGEVVPGLHYRVDGSPRPTVVLFHGGPEGQSRANFNPIISMWTEAGFDVLAPNVRGSTGYGVRYSSLDDRELRWNSVRDGCEVGRWLRAQGMATSLIATGGSYGGFMTLAVLVEAPDLWDAGIDVVGIADWHTFFRNTSGWRRSMRVTEYGEPNGPDGEFLASFSPLRRADLIRAHLLVIHGRNDPRVPLSEAEQIHEAVPGSELLVFDDEGHGIARHGNRVRAYGRALEFVRERLG